MMNYLINGNFYKTENCQGQKIIIHIQISISFVRIQIKYSIDISY